MLFGKVLRELGYVEGQEHCNRVPLGGWQARSAAELAAELVRLKVDIIVADGASDRISSAKKATATIPIVMMSSTDPVGLGLIGSFAAQGETSRGCTSISGELGGKSLELLKESRCRD